jgi:hypothetical protein
MIENSTIAKKYDEIEDGDLLSIIDFFQSNSTFLLSKDLEDIQEIETIYIDYLFSLYDDSRYTKILEAIETFDNIDAIKRYRLEDKGFDKEIRFYKYASVFFKKKYKEAKLGFSELVKDYPDNEDYREWLIDSIRKRYSIVFGSMIFAGIASLFIFLALRLYWNIEVLVILNRILEGLVFLLVAIYFINQKRKITPVANNKQTPYG